MAVFEVPKIVKTVPGRHSVSKSWSNTLTEPIWYVDMTWGTFRGDCLSGHCGKPVFPSVFLQHVMNLGLKYLLGEPCLCSVSFVNNCS